MAVLEGRTGTGGFFFEVKALTELCLLGAGEKDPPTPLLSRGKTRGGARVPNPDT